MIPALNVYGLPSNIGGIVLYHDADLGHLPTSHIANTVLSEANTRKKCFQRSVKGFIFKIYFDFDNPRPWLRLFEMPNFYFFSVKEKLAKFTFFTF